MLTAPNSYPNSDSSFDLLKKVTPRVQKKKVDNPLLEILQQALEKELIEENIVLSRPERIRLFRKATRTILTDMLARMDD